MAVLIVAVVVAAISLGSSTPQDQRGPGFDRLPWPEGTTLLRFEDLEGAILVRGRLRGLSGRDTSGILILDTGAGFLGLDRSLGRWLGVADSASLPPAGTIGVADRPLRRVEVGGWQIDQVSPVLIVDGRVMSRVTGRVVLGLLGQALFRDRVLVLDYAAGMLAVLPPGTSAGGTAAALRRVLSPGSVPIRFRIAGDGKAVLDAWLEGGTRPRRLRLVLDTGATKTVFFRPALERALPGWRRWPRLRGLGAPTLTGDAAAEMTRVPVLRIGPQGGGIVVRGMDAALLEGGLGKALSEDVGEPLDGLLGYSFLKHHRVAIDYPQGTLWVDPVQGDVPDRPYEYSHPGLQLEADAKRLLVYSIVAGSPAAQAGIRKGDQVVSIDGVLVTGQDLLVAVRRLEGEPGSQVRLTLRRGAREWLAAVVRKRLL